MKKKNSKQTPVLLNQSFNDASNPLKTQCYFMTLDIIDFGILKPPASAKKRITSKNIRNNLF